MHYLQQITKEINEKIKLVRGLTRKQTKTKREKTTTNLSKYAKHQDPEYNVYISIKLYTVFGDILIQQRKKCAFFIE
jgi:hypothetical protein